MLGVIRPLAARLARRVQSSELSFEILSIVVALTLASAAGTELTGAHPLFGAFIAGVCFPRVEK
jgi:Kef-type K+ transport system membrane component KefB